MNAKELCDGAMAMAEATLTKTGKVAGMVFLHVDDNVAALPYKDGSMPVGLQQHLIIGLVKGLRAAKKFTGLVLVSEAWLAAQTNPALAGVLRPALDPDRQEVVVAFAHGSDGSRQMVTAAIIREGDAVKLGPPETKPDEVQSWLDDAFTD